MYLEHPPELNSSSPHNLVVEDDYRWRRFLARKTPNGKLLTKNSFFRNLSSSNHIYLAHITFNLNEIEKKRFIFPSGGCLVGSVYCTPLFPVGWENRLRIHNLGEYIYEKEAPLVGKNQYSRTPRILVIKMHLPQKYNRNMIGINYLSLGDIHLSIYKQLEYLLSSREKLSLEEKICFQVKQSIDFLSFCRNVWLRGTKVDERIFFRKLIRAIELLPILGYLYFEALSEYIMLYQDNPEAKKYHDLGELYNPTYKELMYEFYPRFMSNFRLGAFRPHISQVIVFMKEKHIFSKLDEGHIKEHLAKRLISLINKYFFNPKTGAIDWSTLRYDFESICGFLGPLVGHLIHRELRIFRRYPHFYFYFDQTKALRIWNYWNHMDVVVPFNGVIPKGEIGINPAYPNLKYEIYEGRVYKEDGYSFVEPVRKLAVEIVPRLVDLKLAIMRNKH
jgi:hypothetical protein